MTHDVEREREKRERKGKDDGNERLTFYFGDFLRFSFLTLEWKSCRSSLPLFTDL